MAKVSPDKWKKAAALRKAGKSYGVIAKELSIPMTTLHDRSKKEAWDSNKTEGLILDAVRVESEIRNLETEQADVVRSEIARILDGKDFYARNARKAVKFGLVALSKEPTAQGMKTVLDGMKTGMIVEGLVPFYPDKATVAISNTNAQQNNRNLSTMTDAELERIIAGA